MGQSCKSQGTSGTAVIIITRVNYSGDVSLTADGLPTGVTAEFNPATTKGNSSTVTFHVEDDADITDDPRTAAFTTRETNAARELTVIKVSVPASSSLQVPIELRILPDYNISVSPANVTLPQGAGKRQSPAQLERSAVHFSHKVGPQPAIHLRGAVQRNRLRGRRNPVESSQHAVRGKPHS